MRRPALALLAALAWAGCGADDPSAGEQRAEQARAAALDAGLSDQVADVVATAAGTVDETYRVAYEAPADDGGPPNRSVIWQRPPNRRVDLLGFSEEDTQSTIVRDGVAHQCQQESGAWQCDELGRPPSGGLFDPDTVDRAVQALVAQQGDFSLRVEERPMLGVTARCVIAENPDGQEAASLCISREGAVLSLDAASGSLTATEYTTEVPEDVFDLPTGGS